MAGQIIEFPSVTARCPEIGLDVTLHEIPPQLRDHPSYPLGATHICQQTGPDGETVVCKAGPTQCRRLVYAEKVDGRLHITGVSRNTVDAGRHPIAKTNFPSPGNRIAIPDALEPAGIFPLTPFAADPRGGQQSLLLIERDGSIVPAVSN